MTGPYRHLSTDQLEEEYARLAKEYALDGLELLAEEVSQRTDKASKFLCAKVEAFQRQIYGPIEANQSVLKTKERRRKEAQISIYSPTEEQQTAVSMFQTGGNLKINAYAGAGKTSTLTFIATCSPKRGHYIAFNSDIVREAKKKFPKAVRCTTSHSLALQALPSSLKTGTKISGKINALLLSRLITLKALTVGGRFVIGPRSLAFIFLETIRRFCQSECGEIGPHHVPVDGALRAIPAAKLIELKEHCVCGAKSVWKRMQKPDDPLPLGHDGYLKLWSLSKPKISTDFILMDEAQDTNPSVLAALRSQSAQMVYVGDKYQQIYEWRGAVNAMDTIQTPLTTSLTMSFRFGEEIAGYASGILELLGEEDSIQGNASICSQVGQKRVNADAILARTNSRAITALLDELYIGQKPSLGNGGKELVGLLRGVQALKSGRQAIVPDLLGFRSWSEVVEFAESGEGPHLLPLTRVVERFGADVILNAIGRTVSEKESSVVICTAHKSKGREWPSVRLLDDFLRTGPNKNASVGESVPDDSELRLLYVAATRAQRDLEVPEEIQSSLENLRRGC